MLDGFGCAPPGPGNAIARASTPNFDHLWSANPHALLDASGEAVGLPSGQMGNSEVGHLTIGAGRVVLQDLTRIDTAIEDGSFFENPTLIEAAERARARHGRLHLIGLVSPGGVHSHQDHLLAICELARRRGVEDVIVHAITDGRDTPTTAGVGYLRHVESRLREIGVGRLGSISGRYYAMDRDRRWERVLPAFETLMGRPETRVSEAVAYLEQAYGEGVTDEFIRPAAVVKEGGRPEAVTAADVVVHFNFRPDRAREICHALVDDEFSGFPRGPMPDRVDMVTMSPFDDTLHLPVVFPKPLVRQTLAEVVADANLRQFHVAETEKYAHVTYFINGGREEPFALEERLLVPSLKVATYDQSPEMSAEGITDGALQRLSGGGLALLVLNYANADMVGHTGNFEATVQAVEALDQQLGRLAGATDSAGFELLVTADHGNAEVMVDPTSGEVVTAHTTSRVPVLLTGFQGSLRDGGLRDVAPTVLATMGLPVPSQMTGSDLRS